MKWLIASDLHGSLYWSERLFEAARREQPERVLLLGDLLYHGPRNDLPREYRPKEVIALLSAAPWPLLCVRGNCEAEVDQMVLPFPVMADYALLEQKGHMIFVTHGHVWNEKNLPPLGKGDILLHGHTHIPACEERESYVYMNPGSVSIPKAESWHGYMTMEDGVFLWKDMEGTVKMEYTLS